MQLLGFAHTLPIFALKPEESVASSEPALYGDGFAIPVGLVHRSFTLLCPYQTIHFTQDSSALYTPTPSSRLTTNEAFHRTKQNFKQFGNFAKPFAQYLSLNIVFYIFFEFYYMSIRAWALRVH